MKKMKYALDDLIKQKELYEKVLEVDFGEDSPREFALKKYFGKITGSIKASFTGMFDLKTRCELDDLLLNKYEKAALYLGKCNRNNNFGLEMGTTVYNSGKTSVAVNSKLSFFVPIVLSSYLAYKLDPLATGLGLMGGFFVGLFFADETNSSRQYSYELILSDTIEKNELYGGLELVTRTHMIEGESLVGSIYKQLF